MGKKKIKKFVNKSEPKQNNKYISTPNLKDEFVPIPNLKNEYVAMPPELAAYVADSENRNLYNESTEPISPLVMVETQNIREQEKAKEIQAYSRGMLNRKKIRKMKAAINIQSVARMREARKKLQEKKNRRKKKNAFQQTLSIVENKEKRNSLKKQAENLKKIKALRSFREKTRLNKQQRNRAANMKRMMKKRLPENQEGRKKRARTFTTQGLIEFIKAVEQRFAEKLDEKRKRNEEEQRKRNEEEQRKSKNEKKRQIELRKRNEEEQRKRNEKEQRKRNEEEKRSKVQQIENEKKRFVEEYYKDFVELNSLSDEDVRELLKLPMEDIKKKYMNKAKELLIKNVTGKQILLNHYAKAGSKESTPEKLKILLVEKRKENIKILKERIKAKKNENAKKNFFLKYYIDFPDTRELSDQELREKLKLPMEDIKKTYMDRAKELINKNKIVKKKLHDYQVRVGNLKPEILKKLLLEKLKRNKEYKLSRNGHMGQGYKWH